MSLNCHSVIFTDTTSHTLKQFSLEASVLDGKKEVEKVDTIIGDGTSGAEDGFIDVARMSHPTGIISENGTTFFVDTGRKSVRLITKISAVIKCIRVMKDIYRAFHIRSDILGHAELPSLLKAEQRIEFSTSRYQTPPALERIKVSYRKGRPLKDILVRAKL